MFVMDRTGTVTMIWERKSSVGILYWQDKRWNSVDGVFLHCRYTGIAPELMSCDVRINERLTAGLDEDGAL